MKFNQGTVFNVVIALVIFSLLKRHTPVKDYL